MSLINLGFDHNGNVLEGWPMLLPSMSFWTNATVFDFDLNGTSNLLLPPNGLKYSHMDSVRTVTHMYMYELGFPFDSSTVEWGQAGHDRWNTSNYEFREPPRTGIRDKNANIPASLTLSNYPNPFNSSTVIEYEIEKKGEVQLEIYNLLGQKVTTLVHDEMLPGKHSVRWDADKYSSGIYFSVLKTADDRYSRRMVLLK